MFGRGINTLHQPSKKLHFSSMVMRDGLVLPRVPFRPAHRIACILYSVQDKENGLLDGMIEPYRWPNLCRARVTPSWTSSKYSNCLHPPDKFMVLEKKSTIQKSFGKKIINSERNSKFLRVRFDVGSQWQAQQWVASADECTHALAARSAGSRRKHFFQGWTAHFPSTIQHKAESAKSELLRIIPT